MVTLTDGAASATLYFINMGRPAKPTYVWTWPAAARHLFCRIYFINYIIYVI